MEEIVLSKRQKLNGKWYPKFTIIKVGTIVSHREALRLISQGRAIDAADLREFKEEEDAGEQEQGEQEQTESEPSEDEQTSEEVELAKEALESDDWPKLQSAAARCLESAPNDKPSTVEALENYIEEHG